MIRLSSGDTPKDNVTGMTTVALQADLWELRMQEEKTDDTHLKLQDHTNKVAEDLVKGYSDALSALKSIVEEDFKRLQDIAGSLNPEIEDFRSSIAAAPMEPSSYSNESGDSVGESSSLSALRKQIKELEIRKTELDLTISALTGPISRYSTELRKRQEASIAQMSKLKLQTR
jgi:uncharacterized caspase-like protein